MKVGDTVKVGGTILTLSGRWGRPRRLPDQGGGNEAAAAESSATAADAGTAQRVAQGQQAAQKEQAASQGDRHRPPRPATMTTTDCPPRPGPPPRPPARSVPTTPRPSTAARSFPPRPACGVWPVRSAWTSMTFTAAASPDASARRTCAAAAGTPSVPAAPAPAARTAAPTPAAQSAPLPNFEKWGTVQREDMSGIRKATVRSMAASWSTIPMVTHFDKADVTRMEETRKRFGARVEKAGGKLTMTHILMKVVANALRQFPKFGASLDLAAEQVVFKDYVNIGVAVDTPVGLLVPVVKDADRKSITELVLELSELAGKARERKLRPDEMQGATFTISNLGGIGGHAFTPIVNSPEVAILGVSRGGMEPVWNTRKGRVRAAQHAPPEPDLRPPPDRRCGRGPLRALYLRGAGRPLPDLAVGPSRQTSQQHTRRKRQAPAGPSGGFSRGLLLSWACACPPSPPP